MIKKISILKLVTLFFWQVSFAQQTILTDSNLPIMVITTDLDPQTNSPIEIPDEPKVLGTMKLIFRPDGTRNYLTDITDDSFLNYNGRIGIELRGSSSQELEKKSYGFTTLLADDNSNNNVSLLGFPSENDWVLNSLAYDPSMIRDYLSYQLASNMGNYAPRVKYIEVIVNDDYKGVYILTEKIKRDSDRVNLKKIKDSDNSFPEVTGGYIIKADKTTGGDEVVWTMPNSSGWYTDFLHHYPKTEDISSQQTDYIKNVFIDLETNSENTSIANGYPSIIDVPSFVDYMIMAEIASNPDSYQFSTFFHKDRGGKLRAGPVWDYNLSYGNDLFVFGFNRSFYDLWQFEFGNSGAKFWKDLFSNDTFNCYLAKRWFELTATNQPLNYSTITSLIDEFVNLLSESQVRELQRWPPQEGWPTVADQTDNIAAMKNWIQNRIDWIDSNIGSFSNCLNSSVPDLVISKIHYNPQDDVNAGFSSKELEFIEITNNSSQNINLTGFYIRELGISYQFPVDSMVSGNQKIYLCSDSAVFEAYYGFAPFGEFTRDLSNSSYKIILSDAFGNTVDEVVYTDSTPWPEEADGSGSYLQLSDLDADNSLASNWIASSASLSMESNADFQPQLLVYPNPTKGVVTIELISSRTEPLELSIYNSLGQSVGSFQLISNKSEINLSSLSNGFYYYTIKNNTGIILKNKIIKN
ncbi:CotH kinase family protein [Flavobacteriaceae bacterium]|nr:CotH kinase family protein [Flavobacteriaceae bacterium]